jgi:hypothetical protein
MMPPQALKKRAEKPTMFGGWKCSQRLMQSLYCMVRTASRVLR